MAEKSGIEWTDATWNAVTGCDHVSAGCDHCYAEALSLRLQKMNPTGKYRDGFAVRTHENALTLPLKWREPKRIFVNSMSDQWHVAVPQAFTDRMFAVMALTPHHTYQVLTKRPQRAANYLNDPETRVRVALEASHVWNHLSLTKRNDLLRHQIDSVAMFWPLPNVWIGTSVEDSRVMHRIAALGRCPAAVRFLSCEPLIGPLAPDLDDELAAAEIGWVIAGGESGPNHRPLDLDWARHIRDACLSAEVPFFFKQHGGQTPKSGGKLLDGREWSEFPHPNNEVAG